MGHRGGADPLEHVLFSRWKLCLVTSDRCDLGFQRVTNIRRDMAGKSLERGRFEGQSEIELGGNFVGFQVVEMFAPLGQLGIEDTCVGDLHGLPMVWGRLGRLVSESNDDLGTVLPELLGQGDACLEAVKQLAVG